MVKASPKKPPANAPVRPVNPYANIKFSYNGTPLNKKKSGVNSNAIWSVQTGVDCVVISFAIRGDGKSSYVWPFKQQFIDHGVSQGLTRKWGVSGFMTRRLFNEEDPMENKRLPGTPGNDESYPWDALVSIGDNGSKLDASSVGAHLAKSFTAFTEARKDLFNGSRKEFKFEGTLPKEESGHPITRYLIDEDSVDLFLQIYYNGSSNKKEDLMACDPLLADFFGCPEHGRSLLQLYAESKW